MHVSRLGKILLSYTLFSLCLCGDLLANQATQQLIQATFKLFNNSSTATCFLLEDPTGIYLVTAQHVLDKSAGEFAIIVLREELENSDLKRLDHKIKIRDGKRPLWTQHPTQDVAVMRITLPETPNKVVRALPINSLVVHEELAQLQILPGDEITHLSYPQRVEAHSSGYPVIRRGIISSPLQIPAKISPLYVGSFFTYSGDSGGPVIAYNIKDQARIIGLVVAKINHVEKVTTSQHESSYQVALNMGQILHSQYILDTLELCKNPPTPTEKTETVETKSTQGAPKQAE